MKDAVKSKNPTQGSPVWDLPTRLFHVLLICGVFSSWLSYELGRMEWHFYSGYTVTGLLVFRLLWGFFGSRHSRFADFFPRWQTVTQYLRTGISPTPGHNPLGGLSVLALLGLLAIQVGTGLLNIDDEGNRAPYSVLVPASWSDRIGALHEWSFNVLASLIALHVLAVVFHTLKSEPHMIRGMISGHKDAPGHVAPVSLLRAGLMLVISLASVTALVALAPPPPAPVYF